MSSLSRLKLNALDDSTTEYTVCCYYRVFHYSYPVHFCLGHNRSLVCLHAVATHKSQILLWHTFGSQNFVYITKDGLSFQIRIFVIS